MGREANEDRIRELEEKIEACLGDTIQLKRTRNSLLNISTRIPSEILGEIFWWRVQLDLGQFRGLLKDTYKFLLVCHHWSEVASRTPELWSYWGNSLGEWLQQYKRLGTAPVELVLNKIYMAGSIIPLDGPLRDALQDRADHDAIRSVRLLNERKPIMVSVLSTLTPNDGDIRCTSIEFISLRHVDASNFFARCRFPKLWFLYLSTGAQFSAWENLASHTTALTTLVLTIDTVGSCTPTTTQLLSILASNPRLQSLTLSGTAISRDDEDRLVTPVPLRHLKRLSIDGKLPLVFRLLQRLDYPEIMDDMTLTARNCTGEDVLGIVGPYARDHIQRDGRFRDGLGVSVGYYPCSVSIQVSIIKNVEGLAQNVTFATFTAGLRNTLPFHDIVRLRIDFVAHIPAEYVIYFGGDLSAHVVEMASTMPNIQELYLTRVNFDVDLLQQLEPKGPLSRKKLLPSLRRLRLQNPIAEKEGWRPLLLYLAHRTSDGQRISLTITGRRQHICKDAVKEMEGLVDELILDLPLDDDCSFGQCIISEGNGFCVSTLRCKGCLHQLTPLPSSVERVLCWTPENTHTKPLSPGS